MTPTFGSLFSGIGCFDLGLERAGWACQWQVENDPYCREVLARHWPTARRYGDVRRFPNAVEDFAVDLICGGDPCQENSKARVAATTSAPSLGNEFMRVIEALRPRFVLRENPAGVRLDAPWPWWRFKSELERNGYQVRPVRLRACCFGYPHRRERMFLLGVGPDTDGKPVRLPGPEEDDRASGAMQEAARQRKRLWPDVGAVVRLARHHAVSGPDRGLDGPAGRLDGPARRMKALGNSMVPDMGEWLGRVLQEIR